MVYFVTLITNIVKGQIIDGMLKDCSSKVVQARWAKWTNVMNDDITWQQLLNHRSENLTKFHLNATLNTLPTQDNLTRWGNEVLGNCKLCNHPGNLKHILCVCSFSLNQAL